MTRQWHVAQINVGTIKYPTEDPRMQGFMSRLDEINAIADTTPGFVWRLQSESGNATDIDVGGPALFIANMSVWESVEVLFDYVYRTTHRDLMVKRRGWFEKPSSIYQALWWIPAGHVPSVEEGLRRIELLKKRGPTPDAFTFKSRYPAPGCNENSDDLAPDDYCSGWD
ncbi:MAG: DUF3291 domain-containing protein [Pseudomonadota bacterium]